MPIIVCTVHRIKIFKVFHSLPFRQLCLRPCWPPRKVETALLDRAPRPTSGCRVTALTGYRPAQVATHWDSVPGEKGRENWNGLVSLHFLPNYRRSTRSRSRNRGRRIDYYQNNMGMSFELVNSTDKIFRAGNPFRLELHSWIIFFNTVHCITWSEAD